MEGSLKYLFKFMTYVNCYAIKLLRYAIIYSVVVILTVFDTVRGHVLLLFFEVLRAAIISSACLCGTSS